MQQGATTRSAARKGLQQRARGLASGGVAIQMLYRGWGQPLGRDTERDMTDDTVACVLRHDTVHSTIRRCAAALAQCARCLCVAWAMGVYNVYST